LLDGKYVRGLDQTGLAQKGGAVVSDLTISDCDEPAAAKIADGAADLYLSCDVLVGADENYLRAVAPDRTLAVVSTSEVPTGQMVSDPAVTFPPTASLTATFETSCARSIYLDALALSRTVLGSDQQANIIAVGAAYQAGALPISHAALQRAIELNGMDVDENLAAFALGRAHVAGTIDLSTENDTREANLALQIADHPSGLTASKLLLKLTGIEPDSPAGQLAIQRAAELIDYQDKDYACRYLRMLERVSSAEKHLGGDELTASVARSLFSLMAYKDEYEVARLSVRPELRDEIRAQFGPKASFRYRLHPPALRAMGMQRKIALGRWFDPIFRLLYTMRRLRGTVFDPFGIARIRRIERQLIDEYCAVVDRLLDSLTASNRAAAVEVSALPALIRGYEHIKLANIETYRLELQKTMYRFLSHRDGDGAQV
jgi:indolepyruvate ferredoxin oxidoreductase